MIHCLVQCVNGHGLGKIMMFGYHSGVYDMPVVCGCCPHPYHWLRKWGPIPMEGYMMVSHV